ncbi:MAG: hypothetical protein IJ173_07395 [Kiritimatiellae bacterium]|nr:hypothetical protein [Kiritimatiellia bacterium]
MKEMRGIHKFTWLVPSAARLAALAVGILATTGVWADTLYWSGASGADWNTTSAWFTDAELTSRADALPSATDDVVLNLTGETVSVDSITAASLTVNGFGTINVTGDVNVSGGINFAEKGWNADIATSTGGSYTIKLSAATVSAGTLSGYATVETTGGVTASGTSTFYGTIAGTGGFTANGSNITLYGPNSFTGTLNVNSGTFALNSSLDGITHMFRLDASVDDSIATDDETGYVTSWSSQVNDYTFSNSDNEISVTTDYFGGKKAILTNGKFLTSSFTISSSLFPQSMVSAIRLVSQSGAGAVLYGVAGSNVSNYYLGRRTTASNQNSWKKMVGSKSENTDGFWQNGTYGDRTFRTDAEKTFSVLGFTRNSGMTNFKIGGGAGNVAIAEMIFFDRSNPSIEKVRRIENYLAQKWGIDSGSTSLKEVPVTLANGATFDLGGLTRTVASLSGSGTVQNGTLTVTDAINLSAGEVLTLPNTAVFTLGTVAAKIEDTTAGTVTLCGSLSDAVSAYTTGATLTILQSLTDVNLGSTEVSISGIVLADGVSAPTFAANPPFTASYDSETGTLANTRSAATFIYTGDTAYSPVSGNFKIGEVATASVPGAADTVQFDTAASLDVSATTYTYAKVVLNADLTVSGAADTGYGLRADTISGSGKLILDDGAVVSTASGTATIVAPVEVDASSESPATLFIRENSKNIELTGALSGSGSLVASCGWNVNYAGVKFRCSDATQFSGEISAPNNNISRNFIGFAPIDLSKAKLTVYTAATTTPKFIEDSSSSATYKFGALSGRVYVAASEMSNGPCRVEIGELGEVDTLDATWMSSNSERYPNIVKVGTGTLTFTSVSGVNEFILNGGTLVVPSSVTTACSTEMAGYEVVSTTDSDAGTTTYTLKSNKITWTGEGGDSNWTTAGNWSGNAVPTATDFVVFEDDAEVVVPTWATSMCKYMTVNGNVTLAGAALTDNCYCLDVHDGYIDGRGTLTLRNCGLWNATTSANVVISVDVAVESTGDRAQFSRIESDNGTFTLTGDVAVGEGAKLKLKNATATEPEIALGVGAWLVVPSNSSVTTGNIVVTGGAYFETTDGTDTAYVNNTASTWIGGASGNWNTAAKWSSGVLPRDDTVVTFGAIAADAGYSTYTVGISNNSWDSWYDRDKCKSMVLNAPVTLANVGSATGGYLAVYGDITGDANGSLTLNAIGLDNASWNPAATVNVTCPFYVDGSSANACWFADRDVGFNITETGVYALLNMYCPVTVGTLTIGNNAWLNIGANRTMAVTTLVVADGATATISPDEATSTLTAPSPVSQTPQYSVTTSTSGLNVTYTSSLTGVVPGASTVFTDETAANNASVVLTSAQTAQGLETNYYKKEVYESDGSWYVRAVLDDSVVGVDLGEEATAAVSGSAVTITVTNLKPGLCYRIVSGSSADGMTTVGAWSEYYNGSNAPTLSAALPDSGVMYYSVEASDTK